MRFVDHRKVLQRDPQLQPFQYRLDLPLHWKIQQSRLKYLARRLQKRTLYRVNGQTKNCGHRALKRRAKTANSKKARRANLQETTEQPGYVSSKAFTENKRRIKSIQH